MTYPRPRRMQMVLSARKGLAVVCRNVEGFLLTSTVPAAHPSDAPPTPAITSKNESVLQAKLSLAFAARSWASAHQRHGDVSAVSYFDREHFVIKLGAREVSIYDDSALHNPTSGRMSVLQDRLWLRDHSSERRRIERQQSLTQS